MPNIQRNHSAIKLVVAGPGGGKTTGLVDEVINLLSSLKSNRYLAVITYTNTATDKIERELRARCGLPPNLFVGTIHGFLNKFILMPYASLFGLVPDELKFIDELSGSGRYRNLAEKKARDKGVLTYAQIEWIAHKLICGGDVSVGENRIRISAAESKKIARIVSLKLQAIFVDEYQDATAKQHSILEKIIEAQKTELFYFVGDPEQYIYTFRYRGSGGGAPTFRDLPINKINAMPGLEVVTNNSNHRSTTNIVTFLNNFSNIKQIAIKQPTESDSPVYFVQSTQIESIVNKFNDLCREYELADKKKFYLSKAKNSIQWAELGELRSVSNNSTKSGCIFSEIMRYITGVLRLSQKEICEANNISEVELRKTGIKILKEIRDNPQVSEEEIKVIISSELQLSLAGDVLCKRSFECIKDVFLQQQDDSKSQFATIHKAKGLQANAVLVVAENLDRLKKYIETDRERRDTDTQDFCRIGFVGFSRARDLLCIACLENAESIHRDLEVLGVNITDIEEGESGLIQSSFNF